MISELIKRLEGEADKMRAAKMKAYMKDQFEFYGIPTPERRVLSKDFISSFSGGTRVKIIETVKVLWSKDQREFQYIAMDLLAKHLKKLHKEDIALIDYLLVTKAWWDTVDWIGGRALGAFLTMYPDETYKVIDQFSKSEYMWKIRAALIHQLFYREETDKDLLAALIFEHIDNEEFFIKKAAGWALRQYSRVNGPWVSEFIDTNYWDLRPLTRAEGMRYLDRQS